MYITNMLPTMVSDSHYFLNITRNISNLINYNKYRHKTILSILKRARTIVFLHDSESFVSITRNNLYQI